MVRACSWLLVLMACSGSESSIVMPTEELETEAVREGPGTPSATPAAPSPTSERPRAADPSVVDEDGWTTAIDWKSYDEGVAQARAMGKPLVLVVYTHWCGHCRAYRRIFQDPRVVARSRDFVMVRVNQDEEGEVAGRFSPDGSYIPRTLFLAPDGTLAADIDAGRAQYRYFFDERDPRSLLRGMETAQGRFAS